MSDEDALLNKSQGNFVSIMGNTPPVILNHVEDASDLEIIIRFDAFYLATRKSGVLEGHYHDYGNVMKQLPQIISNPDTIVRMDNGRLNIISQITHPKGNNNTVSVELNTVKDINSKNTKYNLVVSIFSSKDNYVRNNLENHGIKVEYQKEDLSQVNPQLYKWLATINDKSSNDSIRQPSEKINPSDENSSKNLSTDVRRQSVSKVGGDTDQASKRTFSYNELVAKGNLTGVVVDKSQQVKMKTAPDGTVKIDDAYIQSEVRKQCEVLHREKGNPVYYVKVSDIGENVEITSKGVKHGYQDALKTNLKSIPPAELLNAQATLALPEILKNSIEVNISDRSDNIDHLYSHIMMGVFGIETSPNVVEYYAVRSVIEERTNQNPILAEYEIVGKLHALNAKKVGLATVSVAQKGVAGAAVPNYFSYSIPQFLDDVKGVFDDTFSNV